jgi:hypothetical protein
MQKILVFPLKGGKMASFLRFSRDLFGSRCCDYELGGVDGLGF